MVLHMYLLGTKSCTPYALLSCCPHTIRNYFYPSRQRRAEKQSMYSNLTYDR